MQALSGSAAPKVLLVAKCLDIGGTEKHLLRILPALRRSGIDASLFVLARGGGLEPELEAQGVEIFGPESTVTGRRNLSRVSWALFRHLRTHRPDIAHFFLPEPYLVGSLAAILARVHTRIMSRRSLAHYQARHPFLARLEWRLHRKTNALIANSSAVLADLSREVDDEAKLGLIYNGIAMPAVSDAATRLDARRTLGIDPDVFLIANVANLIAYKGHFDLLEALASAHPRLPPKWRLFVAGRDDGAGGALAARAEYLGIGDHVIWAGETQNTTSLYLAADVFALTSHEEGFSNSLIEAMAHGLAVVATAVGGNLDAVVPGESGLLVPVMAPGALAQAMIDLAADAALRDRLGQAARQRVERRFSLDACVQCYVNLYRGSHSFGAIPVREIIEGSAPS